MSGLPVRFVIKTFQQIRVRILPLLSRPGLRRAAYLFSARSANSFLSLGFSLMAGRLLTVSDHGLYGKALAGIVVFQAITEIGLQFSLVRFMAPAIRRNDTEETAAILKASLVLKVIAASVVTLAMLIHYVLMLGMQNSGPLFQYNFMSSFWNPDQLALYWLTFIGGVGMGFVSYLDAILVAHEKFVRLSLWIPVMGILRIGLLLLFFYNEPGGFYVEHVVYAYAGAPIISIISYFFIVSPTQLFQGFARARWRPWIGKLVNYNSWILAASFFSIVSDWLEVILIGDPRSTGLFNAARLPMQGFLIILATMQSLLLPRFSGLEGRGEYIGLFKKVYKYIVVLALGLLPGFWLFAWFIPFWYGPDYHDSVNVFLILYPNFIIRLFFAPLGTALFALDQPRLIAVEAALRMAGGLLFNLILIPSAGIYGAAVASFLAQALGWLFLIGIYIFFFRNGTFPLEARVKYESF